MIELTAESSDPLADEDLQLTLYVCYELHYRGLEGVDPAWEWEPALLALRRQVEDLVETALHEISGSLPDDIDARAELMGLAEDTSGPSLSVYLEDHGTLEQMREFCIHRSAYQLKEADPHTWSIPRLDGVAKAALVKIQGDEYGSGDPRSMHSALFQATMAELGLDTRYGAYLDAIPAPTLATVNLASFLGLHRRWRAALIGHLALFEMTSVEPMSLYSRALRRLGFGPAATQFYDVHVRADVEHRDVALNSMVAGLVAQDRAAAPDVVRGARWLTALEARFSRRVLACWSEGQTSLRSG